VRSRNCARSELISLILKLTLFRLTVAIPQKFNYTL